MNGAARLVVLKLLSMPVISKWRRELGSKAILAMKSGVRTPAVPIPGPRFGLRSNELVITP